MAFLNRICNQNIISRGRSSLTRNLVDGAINTKVHLRTLHSHVSHPTIAKYIRSFSITPTALKVSDVKTPNFPESISEGDVRWSKAVGSYVKVDEVLGEIETDKTSLPIVSPYDGQLKELVIADGAKVTKGQVVCKIDTEAQPKEAPKKADPAPKEGSKVVETKKSSPQPQPTSGAKKEASPPQPQAAVALSTGAERVETRVPLSRMRQTIAARLKVAQNTTAMLTTFNELDMTSAIEIRNKYKDKFLKEYGIKLGFMSAFINASVYALKAQPIMNSVIIENEIVNRNYIDISVAVSSPKGLVVPVIRNAHTMNIIQMEKAVADLAEKARNNQLAIEDMEGGTFTISNGGVFGSLFSTPIINMPQSSILGMHSIKDRPVAINGKIEIRPIMYLALTYDHRLIDGREAVTFLKRIKDSLEDPSSIIMGV